MKKPFSQACENNQQPILNVIKRYMVKPGTTLEIGSGTGQHAVFMAGHLPHILWQPTDVAPHLPGIETWRTDAALPNVLQPVELDINEPNTAFFLVPYLFSANTLHIMAWHTVERLFQYIPHWLQPDGYAFFYGPFNYQGRFTSESNARFDQWLKSQAPHQGIRDIEAITALAESAGLTLIEDCEMPSNNRTLIWQRRSVK